MAVAVSVSTLELRISMGTLRRSK